MPPQAPRVFVSYSHDSHAHCQAVLALAQQLRRDGIAAELDQFHATELLHWPRWCEEQMREENADFVLCVCTAEYARRVEGKAPADVGKGVFWEGTLIYNELYDSKGNPRCVPVLLEGGGEADIPRVLKNYTWHKLARFGLDDPASGYAQLYRLLTRQAAIQPAALGRLVPLPEGEIKTDFMDLIARQLDSIKDDTLVIRAAHEKLLRQIELSAQTYPRSALRQLKSPPEHFTGRAEALLQLVETLRRADGAVVISAVNGLGGVGKTALATMAAHAVRADFPDMQLFLELRSHSPSPVPAASARDGVLYAAYPTAQLPPGEDSRWALYRALFEGKRALVVLDDAADEGQIEPLKPPPGCALLITSRRQLRSGTPLHLDRLPRAEAAALLQAWASRLSADEAGRLAVLCGDLPVALKTAGGYLKAYRATPVAEYLAELAGHRLQTLRNDDQPEDDVNRVFAASFHKLSEAEQRAWTALAVVEGEFSRELGKAVIEASRPADAPSAGKLLDKLVNLSLLDYAETSERFSWHDLLREFALERLPDDAEEPARLAHADWCVAIAEQTQALYLQGHSALLQGLKRFDLERAQLEAAFLFLAANPRHDARLVKLVKGVVYTGDRFFPPRQRIAWLQAQTEAAQRLGDKQQEGKALGSLGTVYRGLGKPRKAIEHYEQALVIFRKIGDRRDEGNALGNMGLAYADLGELRKAIEYYEQSLVIARKIDDQRGEGNALGNIGNAYYSLGEPRKAIEYYEQQLVIARDIDDRHGEGNALWNSALAYEALGERVEAIRRAEQALAIYAAIEDPNAQKVRAQLATWRGEAGGSAGA